MSESIGQKLRTLLVQEPFTPTELARFLGMHHFTVSRMLSRMMIEDPAIKSKKVGRYEIFWIGKEPTEEYAAYVRETTALTKRIELLVRLYKRRAFTAARALPLSEIQGRQRRVVDELAAGHRVVVTTNGRVYLTELGKTIAAGATLAHRL